MRTRLTDAAIIAASRRKYLEHPLSPSAMSARSVIDRALSSQIATRAGTATIDGTPVLVLNGRAGQDQIPATGANIARAKNRPPIPPGDNRGG